MDFRIFTEPQQGASYDALSRLAKATEDAGYDAFFRSDHYLAMGGTDGLPGPTDAWLTLAGLARETSRIRLGTLMTAATFRLPGPLAIAVAQVDHMSGGRVELGIGAGWYEREHRAYGLPFPSLAERFDRLGEQLAIITGMWDAPIGTPFTYHGDYYQVTESPGLPKPMQQPRPPIVLGGVGARKTPALTAQYADEFNLPFQPLEGSRKLYDRVIAACELVDRDPKTLLLSSALVLCCGRDEAEVARRAAAIGREPAELRAAGLAGTPAELVDKIGRYAELGVSRFYLQTLDISDIEHIELVASEVVPQL